MSLSIRTALVRAFCHRDAATWLLSKDQLPPTLFKSMMKHAMTGDIVMAQDCSSIIEMLSSPNGLLREDVVNIRNDHETDTGQQQQQQNQQSSPKQIKPEKLVTICHAIHGQYAYITMTDTSAALSFLEKPSPAVPGVRRVVAHLDADGYRMFVYYWQENGNSTMVTIFNPFDRTQPSQRVLMLFKPYPPWRYPIESDILESVYLGSIDCSYCLWRDAPRCECPTAMVQRLRTPFPDSALVDPFTTWTWITTVGELPLQKVMGVFRNHRVHISFTANTFVYMRSTCVKAESMEHVQGFSYYLKSVEEALSRNALKRAMNSAAQVASYRLMIELGNSDFANHAAQDTKCTISDDVREDDMKQEATMMNYTPDLRQSDVRASGIPVLQVLASVNASDIQMNYLLPSSSLPEPNSSNTTTIARSSTDSLSRNSKVTTVVTDKQKSPLEIMVVNDRGFDEVPVSSREYIPNASTASKAEDSAAALAPAFLQEVISTKWSRDNTVVPCKICGILFTRKYDLKRHVEAKHLVLRVFNCDRCSKSFKRHEHLQNHYDNIHLNKAYTCEHCGANISSDANLRRHIQTKHKLSGRKKESEGGADGDKSNHTSTNS